MQRMQTELSQGQGQETEVIGEQGLNVTQSPDVCMDSACAEAADGCMELHTVAVNTNEQHRSRTRQGGWRFKTSRPTTRAEKAGGAGQTDAASDRECGAGAAGELLSVVPSPLHMD